MVKTTKLYASKENNISSNEVNLSCYIALTPTTQKGKPPKRKTLSLTIHVWSKLLVGVAALRAELVVLASLFAITNFPSEDSNSHTAFPAHLHCSHASFLAWRFGRLCLCDRHHLGHLLELICTDLDYIHTGLLQNILNIYKVYILSFCLHHSVQALTKSCRYNLQNKAYLQGKSKKPSLNCLDAMSEGAYVNLIQQN